MGNSPRKPPRPRKLFQQTPYPEPAGTAGTFYTTLIASQISCIYIRYQLHLQQTDVTRRQIGSDMGLQA
jgi:hypothetical protein